MNGIERITGRIRTEAQEEGERRLDAARKSAQEILEKYRRQAESESQSLSDKNAKTAAAREERLVSMAQMEARKTILAARQEMVERAYDRALELLCSMPEKQYVDALAALIAEASATGKEEVLFSAKDQKSAGKKAVDKANAAGKSLTLSKETANIHGGFILRDRNVEVNGSFETLVRLQKTQTAGEVAKRLFPA